MNILSNIKFIHPNNRYGLPVSYKFLENEYNTEPVFSESKGSKGRDPSIGDITLVSCIGKVQGYQVTKWIGNDHATVASIHNFS